MWEEIWEANLEAKTVRRKSSCLSCFHGPWSACLRTNEHTYQWVWWRNKFLCQISGRKVCSVGLLWMQKYIQCGYIRMLLRKVETRIQLQSRFALNTDTRKDKKQAKKESDKIFFKETIIKIIIRIFGWWSSKVRRGRACRKSNNILATTRQLSCRRRPSRKLESLLCIV